VTALLDALNGAILHNLELRSEVRKRTASCTTASRCNRVRQGRGLDQYDRFVAAPAAEEGGPPVEEVPASPRQALEETIWNILVHRQ
jgi:hypothetical protein